MTSMKAQQAREIRDARSVREPARAPAWIVPSVKTALVFADALLAAASFVLAFYVREGKEIFASTGGEGFWSSAFAPYGVLLIFVLPVRLLLQRYYGLYRIRGEFSLVDESVRIFKSAAIGSLLIVATAFLYRGGYQFREFSYARAVFVLDFAIFLSSVGLVRLLARSGQSFFRRRGINLIPTLVVGRGAEAALCIREMREKPELGYRVIGLIESSRVDGGHSSSYEGVPIIGDLNSLTEAIRQSEAAEVIIADPNVPGSNLFEVMMQCGRRQGVEFRIAPNLFNCLPRKTAIDQIGALPMIRLFREPLSPIARLAKRSFDIIIASTALVILSPLWLMVSLLIKLDSKGPVFYVQERVGMDGRLFLFYKFRTMHAGTDDISHREYQQRYIQTGEEANLGDSSRPVYKIRNDSRVTRIGRILRRLSLDEFPQLINVLRGDMSIVGPRPPIPYEVESYKPWHRKRLEMKPGMTGLWQVSGRNRLPFEEMVRLDLFYIENWSLLLDLKIIGMTLPVMLRGRDAY